LGGVYICDVDSAKRRKIYIGNNLEQMEVMSWIKITDDFMVGNE
jgi:hypothetical protein